jgi:hypothetical protein
MTDEELAAIRARHADPLTVGEQQATADVTALLAALEEARRLLRQVEWHSEGVYCGDSELACPFCHAAATETPHFAHGQRVKTDFRAEHDQECPLATFLGRRVAEWTETPG